MSVTDELLANNAKYAETFTGPLPLPPAKHIAVLACMDARINVYGVLGLQEGESHVIRNARLRLRRGHREAQRGRLRPSRRGDERTAGRPRGLTSASSPAPGQRPLTPTTVIRSRMRGRPGGGLAPRRDAAAGPSPGVGGDLAGQAVGTDR